ncbi:hypothetical protein DEM34_18840 [Spiribacter halobius]|uniref:Uncharacterized protein n=2 Tax=Sediminicurvatus halobius TaxID=2182432 RepID=A0A2U2MVU3_9GAMM|nr:hypothetical protein DEM34_18840 [Spiribacter halobius]
MEAQATLTVRFQCAGRDPIAFAEALGCDPADIRWYPPTALADAVRLMRACAEASHLVWPDLRSTLSLLPGAEKFTPQLARFFAEAPADYRARCEKLIAAHGKRTGLVDIELDVPASRHGQLEAIAQQTPAPSECREETQSTALWEITTRLPYARSRATQRELFDFFRNATRGRAREGTLAITERIFDEIGIGEIEQAAPGVAIAPEGVAAFARMLIQEYPARINRKSSIQPIYRRDALARALNSCRHELGPRLRSARGRAALKRIYLDGVPPNSAFSDAGFDSVPRRDVRALGAALKDEQVHLPLHYLISASEKPALEAALRKFGAEPLTLETEAVAGSRRVNAQAILGILHQRRGPPPRVSPGP